MHTTAPERSQVDSAPDLDSRAGHQSEPDRVLDQNVPGEFSGKIETVELWDPGHEFQIASRIAALVSTVVAYPVAYRLVALLLGARLPAISGRDVVLGGLAVCAWVLIGELYTVLYGNKRPRSFRFFWQEAVFLSLVVAASFAGMSSTVMAVCAAMSVLYVPLAYVIHPATRHIGSSVQLVQSNARILIVGSGARAKQTISELRKASCRYEIVCLLDPDAGVAGGVSDVPVLGATEELPAIIFGQAIDMVLFAVPLEDVPNADVLISAAFEIGVPVGLVLASGIDKLTQGINECKSPSAYLRFPVIVGLSTIRRDRSYLAFKRILDIWVSALSLVVLTPLLTLLAILVKVTSPRGPVFYPWKVLGRNGRSFVGYKFRTMVPNADQLKAQLMHRNEMTGPVFKIKNDPRVTPLGRILRKFSLDELPQLYSVLKGDMSLVGPRPPSKQEADQFEFWQRRKLSVTPGITCLWQINGRNQISSFDEWARLDLEYIANASFRMDLRILLRTLPAVIAAKGAH